ncbi:MAG: hypothetical protein KAI95_06695 [Bacteroidales bacterium]|jgi:hypothetical protein|nr:hypothetical protein [Bacteroidales bacterium]
MEDEMLETKPGKRYKSRVQITLKWTGRCKAAPFNSLLYLLRGRIKREATFELIEFKNLVETYGVKFS